MVFAHGSGGKARFCSVYVRLHVNVRPMSRGQYMQQCERAPAPPIVANGSCHPLLECTPVMLLVELRALLSLCLRALATGAQRLRMHVRECRAYRLQGPRIVHAQ